MTTEVYAIPAQVDALSMAHSIICSDRATIAGTGYRTLTEVAALIALSGAFIDGTGVAGRMAIWTDANSLSSVADQVAGTFWGGPTIGNPDANPTFRALNSDDIPLTLAGTRVFSNTVTINALTSGRVTYAGASGLLQDSANLTFDGTNFAHGGAGTFATGTGQVSINGLLQMAANKIIACAASASGGSGYASLNIPHGSAPTTNLLNGDHWTTTAGPFWRINGATVGLPTGTMGGSISVGQVAYANGTNTLTGSAAWLIGAVTGGNTETWLNGTSATSDVISRYTDFAPVIPSGNHTYTAAKNRANVSASGANSSTYRGTASFVEVAGGASANFNLASFTASYGKALYNSGSLNANGFSNLNGYELDIEMNVTDSGAEVGTVGAIYGFRQNQMQLSRTSGTSLTVDTVCGLYLGGVNLTGVSITNHYGIFQVDSTAKNVFNGICRFADGSAAAPSISFSRSSSPSGLTSGLFFDLASDGTVPLVGIAADGVLTATFGEGGILMKSATTFFQGIGTNGSGLKHSRTSTGSIGAASSGLVTITWATSFADANYTVAVSLLDTTASLLGLRIMHIESQTASAITVRVENTSAGGLTGTIEAIALHD